MNKKYVIVMGNGKEYEIDLGSTKDLELLCKYEGSYIKEVKLK